MEQGRYVMLFDEIKAESNEKTKEGEVSEDEKPSKSPLHTPNE